MIKFFRHIRKSLIEQNKMSKYFKYAIGEIILVVIGILIAVAINNWNQRKQYDHIGKEVILGRPVHSKPVDLHKNSYQFFSYAKYIGRAEDYIAAMFKAIYVDGIDLSRADTVQSICRDIGLDIEAAVNFANHDNWQTTIEKTADKLQEQGFWGVPVFTCGDIACWGQDRLWQIEQAIIDSCYEFNSSRKTVNDQLNLIFNYVCCFVV